MNTNSHTHTRQPRWADHARACEQQPTQRGPLSRGLGARWACLAVGLGAALAGLVARVWLAGRWPGFELGPRPAASSDAYSYDTLPINFPNPEFISDTDNI